MKAQEEKRLQIMEAALRRFGHFGISKTTMTEIAADLAMSKASLYYYFPDKTTLFISSLELVIHRSFSRLQEAVNRCENGEEALLLLIDERMSFLLEHYKLFEHFFGPSPVPPRALTSLIEETQSQQVGLLRQIIQKGVESGEFRSANVDKVARILLYALEGMRLSVLRDRDDLHFPTKEEVGQILRLQKTMIELMLDGLRA